MGNFRMYTEKYRRETARHNQLVAEELETQRQRQLEVTKDAQNKEEEMESIRKELNRMRVKHSDMNTKLR